ncbi:hypothetical protein [Marinicella meishanensis]|uniref:hypothetical protein n=1 Tax=Marinicella meishanensis TaxID=2873263 RepID=UPI001CBA93AF|nr:hypothetical protein [Marinicella sp. NBU2979]
MKTITMLFFNIVLPIFLVLMGIGLSFKIDHGWPAILGFGAAGVINHMAVQKAKKDRMNRVERIIGSLDQEKSKD